MARRRQVAIFISCLVVIVGCSKVEVDPYAAGHNAFGVGFLALQKRHYDLARKSFLESAEKGHPMAQAFLGGMYREGQGGERDLGKAASWYEKASEGGDAFAQYNLAVMYDEAEGVSRDPKKAAKLFEKAAEGGIVEAQYNLGAKHAAGDGVEKDASEAYRWFCTAAKALDKKVVNLFGPEAAGMDMEAAINLAQNWKAKENVRAAAMNKCVATRESLSEKKITELDKQIDSFLTKRRKT